MKKVFFVSISMLPLEKLTPLYYTFDGETSPAPYTTRYPSILQMERNVKEGDEVKIVAVMTDDDNDRTSANFEAFKKELCDLSKRLSRPLKVDTVVSVPHSESKQKLVSLLKSLCAEFEEDAEVFMDVTYGTKVTSIELFTSLVFGAKVKNADIRSVVYGKFNHGDSNQGTIYDIRCLYDIANLIYAADHLPESKIESLLNQFWG